MCINHQTDRNMATRQKKRVIQGVTREAADVAPVVDAGLHAVGEVVENAEADALECLFPDLGGDCAAIAEHVGADGAEHAEEGAGGPDGDDVVMDGNGDKRSADEGAEVDHGVEEVTEEPLGLASHREEDVHVEGEVHKAPMDESAGEETPPFAEEGVGGEVPADGDEVLS